MTMRPQHNKFINDTKEFIRLNKTGEVYLFKSEQVNEIVDFMDDEDIDYDLFEFDYYTTIKFKGG